MSVPQPTSPVLGLGVFGLLVGGVLLIIVLVAVRYDRPGDGRCAELWNALANQANRSLVRGRTFPMATVRGVAPNKAGQPGCVVLLRERQDGPWMLFPAAITQSAVRPRPRKWCMRVPASSFDDGLQPALASCLGSSSRLLSITVTRALASDSAVM